MAETASVPSPATDVGAHGPRIPALDGVRAASILLVVAAHMLPLGPSVWAVNGMAARMGMSLFFCLSGFLIVSMLARNPDVPTFLVRRILRIVPALALYLLILVLLLDLPLRVAALNLAFVGNYATEALSVGPTGHLWSLAVEMHFYLAMALATLLLGRRAVWLVPPAALIITGLRIDAGAWVDIKTHLRVDEILSGGTLALLTLHRGDWLRRTFRPLGTTLLAFAVLLPLWLWSCHDAAGAMGYARPYLAASLVGVAIHCAWRPLLAVLESRPAHYVAQVSYALYIYHPLMIFGWMNSGGDWLRYLAKRPISFALTFAAAHASTFWWEARWQTLARRLTAGRRAPRRARA